MGVLFEEGGVDGFCDGDVGVKNCEAEEVAVVVGEWCRVVIWGEGGVVGFKEGLERGDWDGRGG